MIRSPITTAMLCAAIAACSVPATDDTGSVQVALTGTAPSGTVYRLREAELIVSGGGATRVLFTETDPGLPAITASLQPGAYTLGIPTGWFLERRNVDGSFERVSSTMTTPNPQTFTIAEGEETRVTLRFQAGADEVPLDDGTLTVDIGIDEIDAGTPPDASPPDAQLPPDASPPDAQLPPDASPPDAGVPGGGGPVATGDDMRPGEILPVGVILRAPSSLYPTELQLRADGNLVMRSGSTTMWQSNTAGSGGTVLVMQYDGNLVLYRPDGTAVWASQTWGQPGAYLLLYASLFDTYMTIYSQTGANLWRRP
jgi:hypothetical protein